MFRLQVCFAVIAVLALLSNRVLAAPDVPDGPTSAELRRIAQEDQADRSKPPPYPPEEIRRMKRRDSERRKRVSDRLARDMLVIGEDFDHAALVFQHGEKLDDYLIARELGILAAINESYTSLPALAEYRFLVTIHRKQRFVSQSHFDKRGSQHADPIDEEGDTAVTDPLRLDFLTAPLAESKTKFERAVQESMPAIFERLGKRLDPARQEEFEHSEGTQELNSLFEKHRD